MFDYITTSNAKNPKVNVNAQKRKICSHSILTIPGKHAEFKNLKNNGSKQPRWYHNSDLLLNLYTSWNVIPDNF